jgi:hypothetical protein
MKFSELVRLLEREDFSLVKEKGLDPVLRQGWSPTPDSCRFSWREGSADRDVPRNFESGRTETKMKR